jgi:probable phosphoglycerate mutase
VPVEVDIRFIDRDYGVWAGQSLTKVEELWGSIDNAPGVEPRGAVLQRASVALLEVFERLDGKSGLIVSHDAILGPLLVRLAPELDGEPLVQDTGSYNLLERTTNGWRVANTNIVPEA